MIQSGRFNALAKWEMLCRFWADQNSVTDPCAGRFNEPVFPRWQDDAIAGGKAAIREYLRANFPELPLPPRRHLQAHKAFIHRDDTVDGEILRLAKEDDQLADKIVLEMIPGIKEKNYPASFVTEPSPQALRLIQQVFKAGAIEYLRWTEDAGEIPSIHELRCHAAAFPIEAVQGQRKALCLFCALFLGRSDVIHVYDASPEHVTLVDRLSDPLEEMKLIYPSSWEYVCSDYSEALRMATTRQLSYDLVVADQPEPIAKEVAWDCLPMIMNLCTDSFITNYFVEMFTDLGVACDDLSGLSQAVTLRTGVEVVFTQTMKRSDAVYWVVIRRK